MNTSRWLKVALAATTAFFSVSTFNAATAATFDNQEVNADKLIVVATPVYGNNQRQLLIVEQISNKRPCWSESGSNPVNVDPLLLNFDFTGICGRLTDSNGYSIRMAGQDMGLDYLLRIVERNGDLLLVGSHRVNRQMPDIEIGKTNGIAEGFGKIILNPGWRLTRRTYQGKVLGHIYLTNDSATLPTTPDSNSTPPSVPTNPLPASPTPPSVPALPTSPVVPASPTPSPLPGTPQSLPPTPERELIFTKPQSGITSPTGQTLTITPQILTPRPASTIPGFVVPAIPTPQVDSTAPKGQFPVTHSPQTLPSPSTSNRQIPVFTAPRN